jgi:hypothetical protein
MENYQETKRFLDNVDSIQGRFLESLITGQRDPIFKDGEQKRGPHCESGRTSLEEVTRARQHEHSRL